jgi:hypothetical protein
MEDISPGIPHAWMSFDTYGDSQGRQDLSEKGHKEKQGCDVMCHF